MSFLHRFFGPRHPRLPNVDAFRAIVERERDRADRLQCPFTLVAFDISQVEPEEVFIEGFVKVLQRRLRSTDDFGLLTPHRVGIVLPHTGAGGAWKVSQDVCEMMHVSPQELKCEIFEYPDTPPDDDHRQGQRGNDEATAELAPRVTTKPMMELLCRGLPLTKRAIDILISATGLALLSPLFLVVGVAVRTSSPGPAFFKQRRTGLGGKVFEMYKFRSMVVDAEAKQSELRNQSEQDGPAFKMKNDPRVTAIGKFLRSTSVDELPQLINLLFGDMTLVGPRPLPCHEAESCLPWQQRRLEVTPGITCIWQVEGRSRVSFADWMRMDRRYVKTGSLVRDCWLLLATVPAVVLRRGAS